MKLLDPDVLGGVRNLTADHRKSQWVAKTSGRGWQANVTYNRSTQVVSVYVQTTFDSKAEASVVELGHSPVIVVTAAGQTQRITAIQNDYLPESERAYYTYTAEVKVGHITDIREVTVLLDRNSA